MYNSVYWPWLSSLFSLSDETTHVLRNLLFITHRLLKENKPQTFAYSAWARGKSEVSIKEGIFPLGSSS